MPKSIQAPLEPPSSHAVQRMRLMISKTVAAWPGPVGYLVYELMHAAAALTRAEGLGSAARRESLTKILERALQLQDQREIQEKHQHG